jgi:hypothetical protein
MKFRLLIQLLSGTIRKMNCIDHLSPVAGPKVVVAPSLESRYGIAPLLSGPHHSATCLRDCPSRAKS